jgi:hypothetical protein
MEYICDVVDVGLGVVPSPPPPPQLARPKLASTATAAANNPL